MHSHTLDASCSISCVRACPVVWGNLRAMQPAVTCINSMQPKHGVLAAETESEDCCSMQSILNVLPECVVRVLSDFGDFRDPKFSFT